ncbi:MAG: M2 family metallopeptidase [Acidobacteria bacterium]|nr:M2 family metallopeptidase [Acidobacteriota bacterium]
MRTNFLVCLFVFAAAVIARAEDPRRQADQFIRAYTDEFQRVYTVAQEAMWLANTDITDEHSGAEVKANEALSEFVGRKETIEQVKALLAQKDRLDPMQIRQLEKIRLAAAHRPGTIPDVVTRLVKAESDQSAKLFGFEFKVDGKTVTPNDIDDSLVKSRDLDERLKVWTASKEVGKELRGGLETLQELRNRVAREMGFSSYFDLEVADYGMSTAELMALMDRILEDLRPLYRELHTYCRYELAQRYDQPVPDMLPAHWLPNRWGQNWPGLVDAVDMDSLFKGKSREWVVQQAESFYESMGFPAVNTNFWKKSDLYPAEAGRKKNTHASAWHMNLEDDYRSLMSVTPTADWFKTAHHELGHIHYYIAYSNPGVPLLLREGANRSYHEGMGDLIGLASSQRPYLEGVGLLPKDAKIDETQWLLNEALSGASAVFIPFSAGTMTHFEHDLYEKNLPPAEYNARWWVYAKKYQGIVPPSDRGGDYCDAATKTHINDDPAQYYDYALGTVLKFQLHDYIARRILKQDPHAANYFGSKETGTFIRDIMSPGQTKDWRAVLREKTGEDLSARAMLEYFNPLMEYLKKANAGRKYTIE